MAAFPESWAGRLPHCPFRGLLGVHCSLRPACSLNHLVILMFEGFSGFVTSTAAPIATGWSDRCRAGFTPAEDQRLSRRTTIGGAAERRSPLVVTLNMACYPLSELTVIASKTTERRDAHP